MADIEQQSIGQDTRSRRRARSILNGLDYLLLIGIFAVPAWVLIDAVIHPTVWVAGGTVDGRAVRQSVLDLSQAEGSQQALAVAPSLVMLTTVIAAAAGLWRLLSVTRAESAFGDRADRIVALLGIAMGVPVAASLITLAVCQLMLSRDIGLPVTIPSSATLTIMVVVPGAVILTTRLIRIGRPLRDELDLLV
ncbi:hypothetical protein [Nocardia asiatica]|uniref:hypothetical protein n=1 Tax=Nocardia asiatica TaxID=209252 RepID=UPI0002D26B47|nr:hypothetical protein [Nocardia asiatica]